MKKPKNAIEGEGIIIKTGDKYRFVMRIGKILQPLPGKELVRISEKAESLTELRSRLRKIAKKRARELGIDYIINLDPESFYSQRGSWKNLRTSNFNRKSVVRTIGRFFCLPHQIWKKFDLGVE